MTNTRGSAFRLVDGRAVPTDTPYLPGSDEEPPALHGWRNRRVTDAEPGAAPPWHDLKPGERELWGGDALADAWPRLCAWVARTFTGCHVKRTPGATGLSLIEHTLPWPQGGAPYEYPLLDEAICKLIAATSPLHRLERWSPDAPGPTYIYDARLAYAAHMRKLPVLIGDAQLVHDDGRYIPWLPGRYRVKVMVPGGWVGIGLVPRAGAAGLWEWPDNPGEEWETWLDESEMRLLTEHGWPHVVRERLLWPSSDTPGADPLREWLSRLLPAIEAFDAGEHTPANRASRGAVRALLLHPVGNWHRGHNAAPPAPIFDCPADAEAWIAETPRDHALSAFQRRWRRPEWSACVFARTRVAATRRALSVRQGCLRAIVGDAVHCAEPQPWEDTGKVGCYRLKGAINADAS